MKLLNEEKAMELFMSGDIFGLEEMKKQVIETGNSDYSDILNLLDLIINMNYSLIETENNSYASKYNGEIREIYEKMLEDLFFKLNIDIDYYWNK